MAEEKKGVSDTLLTDADRAEIIAWLEKHNKNYACNFCGHTEWAISGHLVTPSILGGRGLMLGGPTYPSFMTVCTNCGNTLMFNAIVAGLSRTKKKEEQGDGGTGGKDG